MPSYRASGRATLAFSHSGIALILLAVLVISAFLMGGGARADIRSLILLRPLTAVLLVLALWRYGRQAWDSARAVVAWLAATAALVLIQLVPLPPALWSALPGREIIREGYEAAGMGLPWLPVHLAPWTGWSALFSLMAPAAALLFALALDDDGQIRLVRLILIIAMVSALIGMLQMLGPSPGPLRLYRVTNADASVGLFANRNHQAVFLACTLPLLAAYAAVAKGREQVVQLQQRLAMLGAALILPLILVTGSRAGFVAAIIALGLSWWVYRRPEAKGRSYALTLPQKLQPIMLGAFAVALIGITLFSTRATSLQRLIAGDPAEDMRFLALPTILTAARDFFPFGTGFGSFVPVFQLYEPDHLLSPNYFNHAHNDYVEWLLTGGVFGVILLLWAAWLLMSALWRAARQRTASGSRPDQDGRTLARAAGSVLVLLVLASAGDYPLRVPSLAVLAAVMVALLVRGTVPGQRQGHNAPQPAAT